MKMRYHIREKLGDGTVSAPIWVDVPILLPELGPSDFVTYAQVIDLTPEEQAWFIPPTE